MNKALDNCSTPFYEKEVKCPVCGETSTHLYLKDNVYTVNKREDDLFISSYKWAKSDFNRYNLYHFYFWHCPHCKFTEERGEFLKKKSLQVIKPNYVIKSFKQKASKDRVISHLSQHIKYPYTDYLSNLTLHLLAIYIQFLPEGYRRDLEKIARYYLRTSWIYRLEKSSNRTDDENIFFEEYMNRYEMMQTHFLNALASLEDINQWLQKQVSTEKEQNRGGWSAQENAIRTTYLNTTRNMDEILSNLKEYHSIGLNYKKHLGSQSRYKTAQPYFKYDSYTDFLLQIKDNWPSVPLSEHMAIKKAIHYFQEIVYSGIFDSNRMKLFNIYKLIAYLSSKVGDFSNAIDILDQMKEKVITLRNAANRRLQRLEIIEDDRINKNMIKGYIQKSNDLLNYINHKRTTYLEEKISRDISRARKLFNSYRNLSPEELEQLLLKEKICLDVVKQFVDERKNESKKGIFQIFKI